MMTYRFSRFKIHAGLLILLTIWLTACDNSHAPKPFGYFRINLPEKNYVELEGDYPFTCMVPEYSQMISLYDTVAGVKWYDMEMNGLQATVHLSYHEMHLPLSQYIEDARKLAFNHMQKASAINYSVVMKPNDKVYGLYIDIEGNDAATPFQFYLTDSTDNFLRGALYFNHVPNNDSVAPIISFIKEDIEVFVESFRWK